MAVLMILLSMLRFILTDPILDLQELIQELKEKMVEVQQYEECWFVDSVGKSGCASWFSRVQKHFVFYLIERGRACSSIAFFDMYDLVKEFRHTENEGEESLSSITQYVIKNP